MKIGILNGDDIGHEIVPVTVEVMRAAAARTGLAIEWEQLPIGRQALDTLGTTLPDDTLPRLTAMDGWVLGPIGHMAYPKVAQAINPHPILRKHFDLFANIRPAKSYTTLPCLQQGVDLVIVRENNEGFQPDRNVVAGSGEFRPTEDVTISVRVITRNGSSKVARAAFELARSRRSHLTAVHKDTVFKLGCGMFAEECRKLAKEFPDVTYDEAIVDTFAMRLVMTPQRYDVVVTTNMFGDILSDLTAEMSGSLGMGGSINAGLDHAMAQAAHGSAPDIAGRDLANPMSLVLSAAQLLDWHGRRRGEPRFGEAAKAIEGAVAACLEAGEKTRDVGGVAGTREVGAALVRRLSA